MNPVNFVVLAVAVTGAVWLQNGEAGDGAKPPPYLEWSMVDLAVDEPLGGLKGDAMRGRQLVVAPKKGNCLACHKLPLAEQPFHGTVGPSLIGIARRLSEGEIRLSIIDQRQVEPDTIMPGYYRNPAVLTQVLRDFRGRTILSAQEVEDVVAYLTTLR